MRPRHYLLIALLVGVFVFNLYRKHQQAASPVAAVQLTPTAPPADTPAWRAFDHAASLRDTPADQFAPALQQLQQAQAATPSPGVSGCVTWLEFYRQGMAQVGHTPASPDDMHTRSLRHVEACTRLHQDTSL